MEIASLCHAAWQRDTTLILLVMGENPTGSVLGGDGHGKHVGAAKGKQYHRQRKRGGRGKSFFLHRMRTANKEGDDKEEIESCNKLGH